MVREWCVFDGDDDLQPEGCFTGWERLKMEFSDNEQWWVLGGF